MYTLRDLNFISVFVGACMAQLQVNTQAMVCVTSAIGAVTLILLFAFFGVAVGLTVLSILSIFGIGAGLMYIYKNYILGDGIEPGMVFMFFTFIILAGICFWFIFLSQLLTT